MGIYWPHAGTVDEFIASSSEIVGARGLGMTGRGLTLRGFLTLTFFQENSESVLNLLIYMQSSHFVPLIRQESD